MLSPKITCIIPVYKVENYLARCIESVLSQTYTDFELILVDDGSPDNSGKICDEYAKKDSRIKVIHKVNEGVSVARNTGLDIAKGEYIYFLDSDDFISPDCFELLYKNLKENDADISIGGLIEYETEEELQKSNTGENIVFYKGTAKDRLEHYFMGKPVSKYELICNYLYKKTLFGNVRFPAGTYYEDEYLNWKLYLPANKVVETEKITYFYYRHTSSATGDGFNIRAFDYLGALEERLEYYQQHDTAMFPLVVKHYRMALLEFFYLKISKIPSEKREGYPFTLKDIHRKYIDSYKQFGLKLNSSIYNKKEKIKLTIFRYSPAFLLLVYKMAAVARKVVK